MADVVLNWFKAVFKAICDNCHDKIQAGDWVAYDNEKNLYCQPCGREKEGEPE